MDLCYNNIKYLCGVTNMNTKRKKLTGTIFGILISAILMLIGIWSNMKIYSNIGGFILISMFIVNLIRG
jgi:hypothetical protein